MYDAEVDRLEKLAIRAAVLSIRLLGPIGGPLKTCAEQGIRAAGAVPLQTVEGLGRTGRDSANRLRCAYSEAREASTALMILAGTGSIDPNAAREPLELFDRVRAMLWRRLHPRR